MSQRFVLRAPQGDLIVSMGYKWASVTTQLGVASSWFNRQEIERDLKSMLKDNQIKGDSRTLLESCSVASA